MTTPPPEPPELDPLVDAASAAIDGVATEADRAVLAADPAATKAIGGALRTVAREVGRPPEPQSPDVSASAVAAALQQAVATQATTGAPAAPAPVAPFRRSAAARWLPALTAVAAALLLIVGVVAMLGPLDSTQERFSSVGSAVSSDVAADATSEEPSALSSGAVLADESQGSSKSEAHQAAGSAGAAYSTAVLDGGDVGRIEDPAELAQRIVEAIDGATQDPRTVTAGAATDEVATCISKAPAVALEPIVNLRWRAVGTYNGARVIALAFEKTDGSGMVLLLIAPRDCSLVTNEDF